MSELSVRQYLHNDGSGLTLGYDKSEADKVIARHKYKRCLAMAALWSDRIESSTDEESKLVALRRYNKWTELAKKFKES